MKKITIFSHQNIDARRVLGKKGGSRRLIICILRYFRTGKRSNSLHHFCAKTKNIISKVASKVSIFAKNVFRKLRKPKIQDIVLEGHKKLAKFKKSIDKAKISKTPPLAKIVLIWARDHAKHLSIFIVASIVLLGNLLSTGPQILKESGTPIDFEIMAKAPRETTDLASTIKTFSSYTSGVKEDPTMIAQKITSEIKLVTSGDNFLVKPNVLGLKTARASTSSSFSGWYQSYQIKRGESIGSIANKFGVSASTILSANNIPDADLVEPGKWIRVPAKNGIMHIVARGETLSELVAYYKGNLSKTASANNLKGAHTETIYVGQKLFIVDGRKPAISYLARDTSSSSGYSSGYSRPSYSGSGGRFPYGYCTWWVASKRYIPWSGNANQWLWNASAMGYATGRSPQVGAIMVTNESWWGHVAYVEAVHGNSVTISEMNYAGWGRVNYRTLSAWYGQYIY